MTERVRPNKTCSICAGPYKSQVDAALARNLGLAAVIELFPAGTAGLNRTTLWRHKQHSKEAHAAVKDTLPSRQLRVRRAIQISEKVLAEALRRGDFAVATRLLGQIQDLDDKLLEATNIDGKRDPLRVGISYQSESGEFYESRPYISHIISAEGYELVLRLVLERLAENIEMKNVSPELQVAAEKFLDALILDKKQQEEKPKESEKSNGLSNETAGTASSVGLSERGGDSGGTSGGGNSDRNITKSAE